jgi:hypothetical protein
MQIRMEEELGRIHAPLPIAWITTINGVPEICIPLPLAEKILYKDQPRSEYYDDASALRDIATLEHEYTHTQGGLNASNDVFFGIAIEERRAELFSGDKMGYTDIKSMFNDLKLITGLDVVEMLGDKEKGGESYSFYRTLSSKLGLRSVFELALIAPSAYIKYGYPMQASVNKYLGGQDALLSRLFDHELSAGRTGAEERIGAKVDRLIAGGDDLMSYFSYRRNMLGLSFVTDKLEAAYIKKTKEKEDS